MRRRSQARRLNPRRAKIHHSYTVAEAALLFGVHRNTVRSWIADGLGVVRAGRTFLILGDELRDFLERRRSRRRVPCGPGEMFCMKCRAARRPSPELVEVAVVTATGGNLRGMCPSCGALMHRRVNRETVVDSGFAHLAAQLDGSSMPPGGRGAPKSGRSAPPAGRNLEPNRNYGNPPSTRRRAART